MSKIFPIFSILFILSVLSLPLFVNAADGLVPCDGLTTKCDAGSVKSMLQGILSLIVKQIATPLAILGMIIGALMMVFSPGNPSLASTGKKILITAIIGLLLAWCTDIIINTILKALGAGGTISI